MFSCDCSLTLLFFLLLLPPLKEEGLKEIGRELKVFTTQNLSPGTGQYPSVSGCTVHQSRGVVIYHFIHLYMLLLRLMRALGTDSARGYECLSLRILEAQFRFLISLCVHVRVLLQ